MADNKKKRGGRDRALIALGESYEVAYWSKKLKITAAQLKAAVNKVGHSAKKVEAYIGEQRHKAADRNLQAITRVTAADVRRVAQRWLDPRSAVSFTYTQGSGDPATYANPTPMPQP